MRTTYSNSNNGNNTQSDNNSNDNRAIDRAMEQWSNGALSIATATATATAMATAITIAIANPGLDREQHHMFWHLCTEGAALGSAMKRAAVKGVLLDVSIERRQKRAKCVQLTLARAAEGSNHHEERHALCEAKRA
jgi:hypothetical protein